MKVEHRGISGFSDFMAIHVLNASILLFIKHYSFTQASIIIMNLETSKPEELLLWATLIFTITKTFQTLIEIGGLIRKLVFMFYPKIKNVYAKVVEKIIRKPGKQSE
ncbi:MAG: hypothetical protein NVV82_00155 [Sporocytophaga sp.]|nr:hypothetical protein [Sporocytophaga sp.]